jgi:hypothetical protein
LALKKQGAKVNATALSAICHTPHKNYPLIFFPELAIFVDGCILQLRFFAIHHFQKLPVFLSIQSIPQ